MCQSEHLRLLMKEAHLLSSQSLPLGNSWPDSEASLRGSPSILYL